MKRQLTRNQSDALRHLKAVGGRSCMLEMPASQQTLTALAQSGLVSVRVKLTQKARNHLGAA